MTVHLSARVAWHLGGWNGRICEKPEENTYCVGAHSYPGTEIGEKRDLEWEQKHAGSDIAPLDGIPPCRFSINAFGTENCRAYSDPPAFFGSGDTKHWSVPPATVGVWPYEEMYREEMRREDGTFNNDLRVDAARLYFQQLEENSSLIFYYSNYSNPFSEEEQRRYVVVGVSRLKKVGPELFYENCSDYTKERFGGGFIWQRNLTSHYPEQGLRIPYHAYRDHPEVLEEIRLVPDNPRNFKYGTRHISDDDALDLVERLLQVVRTLKTLGDRTEDWDARTHWLQSLISELWAGRGLYPGLVRVLDLLRFYDAVEYVKAKAERGEERDAKDSLFGYLDKGLERPPGLDTSSEEEKKITRRWVLLDEPKQILLRDILPRFDLRKDQMERVLADDRQASGLFADFGEITGNPYVLSEQFVGANADDTIPFSKIDHGVFPSPHLGGEPLADPDDPRRLRALVVERLKGADKDCFLPATQIIHEVNHRLSSLPDWKRHQFTEKYLEVDEEALSGALTFRIEGSAKYVYLNSVFDAERDVERQFRELVGRPDITFRSPVTGDHWRNYLHEPESPLAKKNPQEYEDAIDSQALVCQRVFTKPLAVLSGAAGTGKTTIIKAVIKAIEKAHGEGTSFQLLAPTGKAADRIREATGKDAATVHSFLARRGWLNDNLTFRRDGGEREDSISTYVLDEASMLELHVAATLFRAINWAAVQRLILVGDPNQLPPIGRGKVFADLIDWLTAQTPENIGHLQTNVRQMENRLAGRGTGILDLAALYTRRVQDDSQSGLGPEEMLRRLQEGGDVDHDLRVIFWLDGRDLSEKLLSAMVADMEEDSGNRLDEEKPFELWRAAASGPDGPQRADYHQVLTPYRGEQLGTEHLNLVIQRYINPHLVDRLGTIDGVALFDKVIQIRNRSGANKIWAYKPDAGVSERVEIFNGELGFVKPHGFDRGEWKSPRFWFRRLQVLFSRKEAFWVGYGRNLGKSPTGRYVRNEGIEENLELAYALSVHKAQGSEFDRVYFVLPKHRKALLSTELFYTAVTRASRHCTILVEEDVAPFLRIRRPEHSHLIGVNSSLFSFQPVPVAIRQMRDWYEEGKIHSTLTEMMVRSKSEVIIANMLSEREIPFRYEVPLFASDGTFYLPDFTINSRLYHQLERRGQVLGACRTVGSGRVSQQVGDETGMVREELPRSASGHGRVSQS